MPEINVEENKRMIIELLDRVPRDIIKMRGIIESYVGSEVFQEITALKEYLETSDFYTAPASTIYHLNCKGGLAQHSLNSYYTFCDLCKQFGVEIPNRTKILVTIPHDVNKVNTYKDNILKNGKTSDAKPYTTEDLFPCGHGEKSVIILQRYITLTEQEILMIRWHMGVFDRSFMQYESKIKEVCPNAILLHTADWLTSTFVDPQYEPNNNVKPTLASAFVDNNNSKG